MAANIFDQQNSPATDGYLSTDPNAGLDNPDATYGGPGPQTPSSPSWQDQTPPPLVTPTGTTAAASSGGAAPTITNPTDPAQVRAWYQWRATQPGHDPILDTPGGLDYYTKQTIDSGGLTDTNYWSNKSTLASAGGAVGAGGSGGGTGSLWNKNLTLADIQGIPGYQAALAEALPAFLEELQTITERIR